jgi:hypothetical protein
MAKLPTGPQMPVAISAGAGSLKAPRVIESIETLAGLHNAGEEDIYEHAMLA